MRRSSSLNALDGMALLQDPFTRQMQSSSSKLYLSHQRVDVGGCRGDPPACLIIITRNHIATHVS